jgi:hypothetical protein
MVDEVIANAGPGSGRDGPTAGTGFRKGLRTLGYALSGPLS